jgi:hypothetical protein
LAFQQLLHGWAAATLAISDRAAAAKRDPECRMNKFLFNPEALALPDSSGALTAFLPKK